MKNNRNIVIGGEAGQGLVTLGGLLTRALVRSGLYVVVTQCYQSRIRGGHNTYAVRLSTEEIKAPREPIDLLVALNAQSVDLHINELTPDGIVIADTSHNVPESICRGRCLKVPYRELGSPKAENVIALGVIGSLLGLDENLIFETLNETFGKKGAEVVEENKTALRSACDWVHHQKSFFEKLPEIKNPKPHLAMNGNDAIALGALSAGVKFYSFYPMTPSTPIALNLAAAAKKTGCIVEQAEDEISAINMALGASFAGAPAMVGTSGGGFALMVEAVSLAGMTETPIVIVLGQRPAPATGLPTRTEQGDLEFALYSGHGEFPRVIFAPGSVEECFYLTRRAFEQAEKYQSPAFVLTDQFLADSYRAVKPFDIENLAPVKTGGTHVSSKPYRRFEITQSGVSPRLLPGLTENLVVVDSDEHTEDGHITEDLKIRRLMVEKRMRKLDGLKKDTAAPEFIGDENPDLLFVSWGSTKGSVLETAEMMTREGKSAACLHFSQVWPLIPDHFMPHFKKAKRVACVEGNATGQFANLIRRETGFEIQKRILRYDGLPITPEYVYGHIK
jgi:2-oxoglutarate ferredoxin oxidoreductase subunit alpha